jgi:hypothetical protein
MSKKRQLPNSVERTMGLLSAMTSGMALNQAAGCGYHGVHKMKKRARLDNRREARAVARGWRGDYV